MPPRNGRRHAIVAGENAAEIVLHPLASCTSTADAEESIHSHQPLRQREGLVEAVEVER